MPAPLVEIINKVTQLFSSCDIDYELLNTADINEQWFEDYNNQRIVNSFLFNYIKIQDSIGARLFRQLLYQLREIDQMELSMIDILNHLERLAIIDNLASWDRLRTIRNTITQDYPDDLEECIENIKLTLNGYRQLKQIFRRIEQAVNKI